MLTQKYGKCALVTGASSGIGEAFCKRLLAEGFDVVGVARRGERLAALATSAPRPGSFIPISLDLAEAGAGARLKDEIESRGLAIDILINNAGFGLLGAVEKSDLGKLVGMVDLNCRAVVELTHTFLPSMKARRRGAVIIVSSVVGAIPTPWFSVYAATKSFDLYFGEALHAECSQTGVDVLTVLPGLTRTEFHAGAGTRTYHVPYRTADDVVHSAMTALGRKAIVVDGWLNKVFVHSTRFLPRCVMVPLSRFVMQREMQLPIE